MCVFTHLYLYIILTKYWKNVRKIPDSSKIQHKENSLQWSVLITACHVCFQWRSSASSTDNTLSPFQLRIAPGSCGLNVSLQLNHSLTYCLFLSLLLCNKLPHNSLQLTNFSNQIEMRYICNVFCHTNLRIKLLKNMTPSC